MKDVNIGSQRYTKVICTDKPGIGGACHAYQVRSADKVYGIDAQPPFAVINFQNGPIGESGVNGCHNEDLIAIVIDRLQDFQNGRYACPENDEALAALHSAMTALNRRTAERKARGVEGTHKL